MSPRSPTTFWATVSQKLRPAALAAAIDFGKYLILWTTVLGAHFVKFVLALAGVDPDLVSFVGKMEKWLFFASFVTFFIESFLKIYQQLRRRVPFE